MSSPPVNTTIYSGDVQPGWSVKALGSRGVRQQQVVGAVNNGSQAFCATLPAEDVSQIAAAAPSLLNMVLTQLQAHCSCYVYTRTRIHDAVASSCVLPAVHHAG